MQRKQWGIYLKGIKGYLKFMDIKNDNLGDVKDYLLNEKEHFNSKSSKEELTNKATLNTDELIARVCGVTDVCLCKISVRHHKQMIKTKY